MNLISSPATLEFESLSRLSAKADPYALVLTARHQFAYASHLEASCTIFKTAIPDNIDVVTSGKLVLLLSGHFGGSKISPDTYANSALAQYIVGFLRNNSADLAIEAVSDVFSDESGQTKVILTFARSGEIENPYAALQVTLQAIHLDLTWTRCTKNQQNTGIESSVFSEQMSLPIQGLVENAIGRFVTWHLVRRYPLIFGAWNKQLADEIPFFRKLYRAISGMARRSPNSFKSKYNRIVKTLRKQHVEAFTSSRASLFEYLHLQDDEEGTVSEVHLSDETVFCLAMERLYRAGIKRPRFKGSTDVPMTSSDALDDDTLSHDHSLQSTNSSSPPATPQDSLWDTLAISIPLGQDLVLDRYPWALHHFAKTSIEESLVELTDDTDTDEETADTNHTLNLQGGAEETATITQSFVEPLPGNRMSCDTLTDLVPGFFRRDHQDDLEFDWDSDEGPRNFAENLVGDFCFEEEMTTRSREEGSPVLMALDDAEFDTHQVLEHGDEEVDAGLLYMDDHILFEEHCTSYDIEDVILQ
ncbi:hypothetical protein PQX77_011659 [Marasmius sp. AFHP31]|nr:hypothetical protein PQX77_011659 [Marasmius sp. AFHP31]